MTARRRLFDGGPPPSAATEAARLRCEELASRRWSTPEEAEEIAVTLRVAVLEYVKQAQDDLSKTRGKT